MNFVNLVATKKGGLIYLIQAQELIESRPAWYYIRVDKLKIPLAEEKVKTMKSVLELGSILFSGWGENPPEYIKRKIEEYS